MYQHITVRDAVFDVMSHPVFRGRGRLIFPWDEGDRYSRTMTMADMPHLHLWHTNMDTKAMVAGVNRMIDDANAGKQVLYDIYTETEKAADPTKKDTGLFFFRGSPGAPFAIVSAGGGFYYVGSLHEGFPLAMELNKSGYNAFVLKYRVGQGEMISSLDLIAAVNFVRSHATELGVGQENYSLWGGSAGARMSSNVSYGEGGIVRPHVVHPSAVIMAYTTYAGRPDFIVEDPAGFMIVGTNDWIVPASHMQKRADRMRQAGINVECIVLPGVQHGFGIGQGMSAEGWMGKAIAFWKDNMK